MSSPGREMRPLLQERLALHISAIFLVLSKFVFLSTPLPEWCFSTCDFSSRSLTFVQDGVGWLVARQRLFAEVLVRLRQALHLGEASVERHGRVAGVLGHVQVGRPPQLLLDDKRLLQQLEEGIMRYNLASQPCISLTPCMLTSSEGF